MSLSRVDGDNAQLDGELRHELFSHCGYDPWLQIWANTRNDRYPMMNVWSRRGKIPRKTKNMVVPGECGMTVSICFRKYAIGTLRHIIPARQASLCGNQDLL